MTEVRDQRSAVRGRRTETTAEMPGAELFLCALCATVVKSISGLRVLIAGLCAMLLPLCSPVEAQQPAKVHRIGVLSGGFPGSSPDLEAFRLGLRELGYVEGKNLVIEYRYTEGKRDRYPDLLSDLARLKVDVIIGNGTGASIAAKKATNTIPIVMTSTTDPVGNGLIASLARPGGNVTGLTNISGELGGKLLELLKEIDPKLTHVAIVIPGGQAGEPGEANKLFVKEIEIPARALGVQLISLVVRGPQDYEGAVRGVAKERTTALISRLPPGTPSAHRKQFVELAVKSRLPVASATNLDTEGGGLISYGRDPRESYRRAATYVDKILKGANPAELPVEAPTKLSLVINLKTAKQIGVTIPQKVMARADKVIR
jgi:putative tryptophan/tyrosine transport system substrate-binding protein